MDATPENDSSAVGGTVYTVPFIINGKEVLAEKSFDVISPSTGKVVHRCSSASDADVDAAVDAAAQALKSWRGATPQARRAIFLKSAEIMVKRRDELAQYMMDEMGCARVWSDFNMKTAIELITDVAGRISAVEGAIPVTEDPNVHAMVVKEPFGVILAIAPW
jgi:acyl-CoA reductase-like NAD-dependent aldehyde dehydrogenase